MANTEIFLDPPIFFPRRELSAFLPAGNLGDGNAEEFRHLFLGPAEQFPEMTDLIERQPPGCFSEGIIQPDQCGIGQDNILAIPALEHRDLLDGNLDRLVFTFGDTIQIFGGI